MAIYNITGFQNVTSIGDMITTLDTEVLNSFSVSMGAMFLIAVFFIVVFSMKRADILKSIVAGSWICFVLAGLMAYAGMVTIVFPILFLTMTAFGLMFLYLKERD